MGDSYLISGSILGADHLALGKTVAEMEEAGIDLLQIDVADGVFTPTITFGEELVRRIREETTLPLEVHLMVSRPQDWFEVMGKAGADVILFHSEVPVRVHGLIEQARQSVQRVGIVLNTETPPEAIRYLLPHVDVVMLMGILPGFAGQRFVTNTLDKLRDLREMIELLDVPNRPLLSLDGGVTIDNAGSIVEAGADILVAASALTGGGDVAAARKALDAVIDEALDERRPWVSEYQQALGRTSGR